MCTFLQLHFYTLLEHCINEEMLKLSYCLDNLRAA